MEELIRHLRSLCLVDSCLYRIGNGGVVTECGMCLGLEWRPHNSVVSLLLMLDIFQMLFWGSCCLIKYVMLTNGLKDYDRCSINKFSSYNHNLHTALKYGVKTIQSWRQRHQNDVNDTVVVSLLLGLSMFCTFSWWSWWSHWWLWTNNYWLDTMFQKIILINYVNKYFMTL